jgi:hypothetical protein
MPYLVEQLPPGPIIVKGHKFVEHIIGLITIILFLIFVVWLVRTITASSITQNSNSKLLLSCPSGQCGTNMLSGEKRCPESLSDVILIDPSSEVCNPKFSCTSTLTPYALLSDGSTSFVGTCEAGNTCRCLKYAQCGTHVCSLFKVINGSLYAQAAGNRFTFSQVPLRYDIGEKSVQYETEGTDFCGIKASNLNKLSPGSCTFTDKDFNNDKATLKIATDCINANPCVLGTMVFNTTTPELLEINGVSLDDVRNIPVTCVRVQRTCNAGQVPYWDNRYGTVGCAKINYTLI